MGDGVHPDRRIIMDLRIVIDQLSGHDGDVPGRSHMSPGFCQAAAVFEMSVGHAQALSPLIHHIHKRLFVSGYVFCHGYAGIVPRGNDDTFDQCLHSLYFSLFQKNLGSPHGFCVGAGRNLVCHGDPAAFQGIKDQDQRHDLGDAGRASLLVWIFLIDHLTGGGFHEDG